MKVLKEIKVCTGEYTNQNGEQKKRYQKIGVLFVDENSGNMSMKLDVLPMPRIGNNGKCECWLSLFDPYNDNQQQAQAQPQQQFQQPAPQMQQPQHRYTANDVPPQQFQGVNNSNDVPF